jgi:hypothetical protein
MSKMISIQITMIGSAHNCIHVLKYHTVPNDEYDSYMSTKNEISFKK